MSEREQMSGTDVLGLVFPVDNEITDAQIDQFWEESSQPFAREVRIIPSGNVEPIVLPPARDTETTPCPFKRRSDLAPTIMDRVGYGVGRIASLFFRL